MLCIVGSYHIHTHIIIRVLRYNRTTLNKLIINNTLSLVDSCRLSFYGVDRSPLCRISPKARVSVVFKPERSYRPRGFPWAPRDLNYAPLFLKVAHNCVIIDFIRIPNQGPITNTGP